MTRAHLYLALAAAVVVALVDSSWISQRTLAAQAVTASRSLPTFEVDRAWPKLPPKWKLGDPSSFAIDAQDNVWLLHRPRTLLKPEDAKMAAPPVVVFDTAGTFIKAWGGDGAGYQWPEREHGIHIDAKGFVWITGNNCPTNELFVADGYGNHRVVVFNPDTGAYKRMWGAFGNKPMDDDHCEVVTPTSYPPGPGPQNFSIVHALRVARDGMVYVADRENRRVQQFSADGKFVRQLVKTDTQFARNLALSADPAQQYLYVGNGQDIVIVDRKTLEIAGSIKPAGLTGAGHHLATDSKGNLYVAQTGAGMQKLVFKGMSGTR